MSTVNQVLNNGQQTITNYNTAKLFIGGNRYVTKNVANATGSTLVLTEGMVMGVVNSTGKAAIAKSGSTDGSQVPRGILHTSISIANGSNADVKICVSGDVNKSLVKLDGSDTFATQITIVADAGTATMGRIEDLITGLGINLVPTTENTAVDNQ